ncbi:nucleoside diphosphate kinase [Gorgonomyces haynaldii]|nr:nucleoside diphosphate kinase [Gorgonomyces haynaldii]
MSDEQRIRYCFIAEWFDIHAQLTRKYEFFYYPADASIEMYDPKQHRTFLKRSKSSLTLSDLFIGSCVNVHARQLTIKDYADEFTRRSLAKQMTSALVLVKQQALKKLGQVIDILIQNKFTISRARMLPSVKSENGSGVLLEVIRDQAQETLASLISNQKTFESVLGGNWIESPKQTAEVQALFSDKQRSAVFKNSTLCIIRPHALIHGQTGKIVQDIIDGGFQISDLQLFHLNFANGEEFLEVYKGVVPEYHLMLDHLTSGPLVALEITGSDDIVQKFREFCGPVDPELAKKLRPQSLRAKYGIDKVKNGVHCTDLPDDGVLEVAVLT